MKNLLLTLITVLSINAPVLASTFICHDPNDYERIELVNGNTGTALYFKVGSTTLYRHGTGTNGESVYVDENGEHKLQVKWIDENLTFIKLYHMSELKVILSCSQY